MAVEQINFMNELQKSILKYGTAASLLFGALWYQTNRLEAQEVKSQALTERMENRIKEVEQGLNECNTERATLKIRVDMIQQRYIDKYEKRNR